MADPAPPAGPAIRRHALATRLWHWLSAVAIFILIGSGIGILKAHPRLYWGEYGANFDRPWTGIESWPDWSVALLNALTIPARYNLAMSRRWHLFFALVLAFALLAYMVASLVNRHFHRDLRLRRREVSWAHVRADFRAHLALRFHDPEHPGDYNLFQKASYVAVIFIALPLMIATGLALSPGMNAAWPWLLHVLGGRQSARSLHFIAFVGLTGFVVVHLALVVLAGALNEVRSMLTGRWRVPE